MKGLVFLTLFLVASTVWAEQTTKYSPPSSLGQTEVAEDPTTLILENEMKLAPASPAGPVTEAEAETVSVQSTVESADKNLSEDQIPVLKEKEKPVEASSQSMIYKVVVSFGLVVLMILGLAFSTRKYFQKSGVQNKHTNIRVITQHQLGAKRNLAIISVAGEYILLGVTDHNINLIKTLTLMDDEIPETPKQFNAALQAADTRPDFIELTGVKTGPPQDPEEGFSIRNIKEIVSQKLRGMKEFS